MASKKRKSKAAKYEPQVMELTLAEIKSAGYNPRVISPTAIRGLTKSIEIYGCVEPIVVNIRDGKKIIVGGHQRYAALKRLRKKKVTCVTVKLNVADEKALNLALNNPTIQGRFFDDIEKYLIELREEIGDKKFLDLQIDKLQKQIGGCVHKGLVVDDEAPALPKKAKTKPGDLWLLGRHRLVCGDCREPDIVKRLMGKRKADMVFTDPPYGIEYDTTSTGRSKRRWRKILGDHDDPVFIKAFVTVIRDATVPASAWYICYSHLKQARLTDVLDELKVHWSLPLVWVKNRIAITWDRYHPQHEIIIYCGEGSKPTGKKAIWYGPQNESTVWNVDKDCLADYKHPTQKPVELVTRAIKNSSKPDISSWTYSSGQGRRSSLVKRRTVFVAASRRTRCTATSWSSGGRIGPAKRRNGYGQNKNQRKKNRRNASE